MYHSAFAVTLWLQWKPIPTMPSTLQLQGIACNGGGSEQMPVIAKSINW